jgi:hypothetical protein
MKTQVLLHDVPLELRDALELRARTEGTSVASVIGEALSSRYRLKFTPSPPGAARPMAHATQYVRPNGHKIGYTLNVRLPPAVVTKLREEAGARGRRQRDIVLDTLASRLGVKLPDKPRNRGHGRPRGRMVKT